MKNSKNNINEEKENRNIVNNTHQYKIATCALILSVAVSLTMYIIPPHTYMSSKEKAETSNREIFKKFSVYGKNIESGYLENVFTVLQRLGYEEDSVTSEWDLLWAHNYPFNTLYSQLNNLKPHQKVNKLPGSGYITNKVDLATSELKYIPPAFRLPKDKEKILKYAKSNLKRNLLKKVMTIEIFVLKNITDINLDGNNTFVQEFVDNPLLISGYKFDIGVYAIFTSVDPLRIYIYKGDSLLRFCPIKYHPFDPHIIDKYVVGDDYLPTWDVPGLKHYYKTLGFGMAESLNAYLTLKGKDPLKIWEQIEDSIRIVGLAKEQNIVESMNRFASKNNFFEMMRFDFVVNENLEVFLMEANMSPNLSSAHFPPNRLLFEQIIFNLFRLVGVQERVARDSLLESEKEMIVANKNVMVFPNECNSVLCRSSCMSPVCQLCRPCLSEETRSNLLRAYLEHMNKGECKRIYPQQMKVEEIDMYDDELEMYTPENQLQYRWFQGKCLLDTSWCA